MSCKRIRLRVRVGATAHPIMMTELFLLSLRRALRLLSRELTSPVGAKRLYYTRPAAGVVSMPHSFVPLRILKYPFSPQAGDHEFATSQ